MVPMALIRRLKGRRLGYVKARHSGARVVGATAQGVRHPILRAYAHRAVHDRTLP